MPRYSLLVASVAVAALALLTHTGSAHADGPAVVPVAPGRPVVPAVAPVLSTAARIALTTSSATAMGSLMLVLDVLGIMESDTPKHAPTTRTATFLSPEPPKTPLIYSSLVVAKF